MKSIVEEKWRDKSRETIGMTWYRFFWISEMSCTSQKFALGHCLQMRQFENLKEKIRETLLKNVIFSSNCENMKSGGKICAFKALNCSE